jgi:hypothetical protein
MNSLNLEIKKHTPLLLRRTEKMPVLGDGTVTANMTVVTTSGNKPEMGDQMQDATAPRSD